MMQPQISPNIRPSRRQIQGLVLDMPCQENSGGVVNDLSGNDNHGTLNGDVSLSNGALVFGSTGNPYVSIGARPSLDMQMFKNLGNSGDLNFHQGLGVDVENNLAWLLHTINLQKVVLGQPWTQLAVTTFNGSIFGNAMKHTNDGNYVASTNKFYFISDQWDVNALNDADVMPNYFNTYNADTLVCESAVDMSSFGYGFSGSFLDVDAGLLYAIRMYVGNEIHVFNWPAMTLNHVITLDADLTQTQGITKKGNLLYVAGKNDICRVKLDGTVLDDVQNSINEGLDYTSRILYAADEHTGSGWGDASVWTLEPREGAGGFSGSMWVNCQNLPSEITYIRWLSTLDISIGLYYDPGGKLIFKMSAFSPRPVVLESELVKNAWQHFLITYDHGGDSGVATCKIYINGVEKASTTGDPQNLMLDYNWTVGHTGFSILNSQVKDVNIYNRALSADEIKRIYEEGL